jgi:hypothetical protein
MKAILVRIGVDSTKEYGGWNAPANPKTGEFVYVPIPDGPTKRYTSGNRCYSEVVAPLTEFATRHRLAGLADLRFPETLLRRNMHLDPDFDQLTYGDNGKEHGLRLWELRPGDLVVFYAGLRSIARPKKLLYALVGLFVVEEVVAATAVQPERRHENAHTRWTKISKKDVVVRGQTERSGRLDRCIRIGEFRNRAYRVSPPIENAWGGLEVKDGFIQRNLVPPWFRDAEKFYDWFVRQRITLVQRNN